MAKLVMTTGSWGPYKPKKAGPPQTKQKVGTPKKGMIIKEGVKMTLPTGPAPTTLPGGKEQYRKPTSLPTKPGRRVGLWGSPGVPRKVGRGGAAQEEVSMGRKKKALN